MLFEDVTIAVQPCAAAPKDESPVLCFQPGQVLLVEKEGVPCLPVYRQVKPLLPEGTVLIALLTADGQAAFTPDPLGDEVIPQGNGLSYGPMRLFREMDCRSGAVLTAAHHLWQWMRRNRFCGGCDRSVGYVLFLGLFQKGFGGECESVGELQFLDQQNVVVARSGAERKTRMSLRR